VRSSKPQSIVPFGLTAPASIFNERILSMTKSKDILKNSRKTEPQYIHRHDGKIYCHLVGEFDRSSFSKQCSKCPLQTRCVTKKMYLKNVAGDQHMLNASGFFGEEFTQGTSDKRKELRATAKIIGLSLVYGAYSGSVATRLGITQEEAQILIDRFFKKLGILKIYMDRVQREALLTGQVQNLFFRLRDVSKDAWPDKTLPKSVVWKMQGYARRTALNHPIQSTAADVLKIGSIRTDEIIRQHEWSPYSADSLPQSYDSEAEMPNYTDFKAFALHSNHDELIYGVREDSFDGVIPSIYICMQEDDILEIFNAGFRLEMDCEYDSTRSWTAQQRFDSGEIYLLQELQNLSAIGGSPVVCDLEKDPDIFCLVDIGVFTEEVQEAIQDAFKKMKQNPKSFAAEGGYRLATFGENGVFYVNRPLPESLIQELDLQMVPAQFVRSEEYSAESGRGF
jgi:hypothetical protein